MAETEKSKVEYFSEEFKGLSQQEILDNLVSMSDGKEVTTYIKQFAPEEIQEMHAELPTLMVTLDAEEEALKEEMKARKDLIKSLTAQRKELVSKVRRGYEEVTEDVFIIKDWASSTVVKVNKSGVIVNRKPMGVNDRQMSITDSFRKAN